jgi:putative chitinase
MNEKTIANILVKNPEAAVWAKTLGKVLPMYEINTDLRIAAFLAQTCHESNFYTQLEESLNYSVEGLMATWPAKFPKNLAEKYGRTATQKANQAAIGNIAYASRMGNGDAVSGDGYKYRGRGLIQLTGRANYTQFSSDIYGNDVIVKNPELIVIYKEVAVHSAAWFWKKNNLDEFADNADVVGMTRKINGGSVGLDDRARLFEEFRDRVEL